MAEKIEKCALHSCEYINFYHKPLHKSCLRGRLHIIISTITAISKANIGCNIWKFRLKLNIGRQAYSNLNAKRVKFMYESYFELRIEKEISIFLFISLMIIITSPGFWVIFIGAS